MKILVLSDLHIAQSTPWSSDYEDINRLNTLLGRMKSAGEIPDFDMCLLCGDVFNSPRLTQGDYPKFATLLETLGVLDKPILAINGNHDPGGHHVCENLKGFHRLDISPLMGICGHSYSQDLDQIRGWLKNASNQITVTHQSCGLFMNLGNLSVPQILEEDFHAPLNFIGDTHITKAVTLPNGSICVSPGILCPMRSKTELLTAEPHLTFLEADYLGDGRWDLENADLRFIPIIKRKVLLWDESLTLERLKIHESVLGDWEPPVVIYVKSGVDFDFSSLTRSRIVRYTDVEATLDTTEDYSAVLGESKTLDTILTVSAEILKTDPDSPLILELLRNILDTDQPADAVKHFLESK